MSKSTRAARAARSAGNGGAAKPGAPTKSLTVGMGGFDGLIDALGRIPRDVRRALPLLESGQFTRGSDALTSALVEVELAKAAILGNLAFAAI